MSDFGMAMLFTKFMREQKRPIGNRRVFKEMAKLEREDPGEWFRFLSWAAVEKARRTNVVE